MSRRFVIGFTEHTSNPRCPISGEPVDRRRRLGVMTVANDGTLELVSDEVAEKWVPTLYHMAGFENSGDVMLEPGDEILTRADTGDRGCRPDPLDTARDDVSLEIWNLTSGARP